MPPRNPHRCCRGPGALWVFLSLIFAASLPRAVAASNISITTGGASGADEFHTPPFTNSSIPPDTPDDTIPRWTTQACNNCHDEPSLGRLQDRTYTALYLPAGNNFTYDLSFQFSGTAIYVYFFLTNQAPTTCDFVLDGNSTPYWGQTPDPFAYNMLAFSKNELALDTHHLTIRTSGNTNTANYVGFDFANFTRPPSRSDTVSAVQSSGAAAPSSTSQSGSSGGNWPTAKGIIGGVVGGFLAIILLILVASFYRNRRLRDLEKAAHPFFGAPPETRVHPSNAAEEEQRLMPQPLPSVFRPDHTRLGSQTLSGSSSRDTRPRPFPLPAIHAQSNADTYERDQVRRQRQQEINNRLQAVTTQMRSLKSSYLQDHQRLQNLTQQHAQEPGQMYRGGGPSSPDMPVIRLVPGGMPDPVTGRVGGGPGARAENTGEPMVNPDMLGDMRDQMRIMMDQIQYLRAQQNSPYAQGLTDEPPPGYHDAVSWDQLR